MLVDKVSGSSTNPQFDLTVIVDEAKLPLHTDIAFSEKSGPLSSSTTVASIAEENMEDVSPSKMDNGDVVPKKFVNGDKAVVQATTGHGAASLRSGGLSLAWRYSFVSVADSFSRVGVPVGYSSNHGGVEIRLASTQP